MQCLEYVIIMFNSVKLYRYNGTWRIYIIYSQTSIISPFSSKIYLNQFFLQNFKFGRFFFLQTDIPARYEFSREVLCIYFSIFFTLQNFPLEELKRKIIISCPGERNIICPTHGGTEKVLNGRPDLLSRVLDQISSFILCPRTRVLTSTC